MIFLISFLAAVVLLIFATYVVDFIIKAPSYKGPKSGHFNGKTFRNLDGIKARGFKDIIKWALSGDPGVWEKLSEEHTEFGTITHARNGYEDVHITFVNHATFLIQVDGINILTDPVWSLRASPFQWTGPKRMRPPGIDFKDLPEIDLVLISHNHYDHLDKNTVRALKKAFDPQFIVPLGVSEYLNQLGIEKTEEMDWWNKKEISDMLSISSVPAQHFSGRGLTDRDKTLWCGYVLEAPSSTIYFAGDTGYDGFFKKIGAKFKSIDVALIPIGAYRPRWFMRPIHVNPEEAVLIHRDIDAGTSIGMHFGTFPLADDGMSEPREDLEKAKKKHNLSPEEFIILDEGETYEAIPRQVMAERKTA
ncbi:twin-arginine translocation pathway signal [Balneolaceae bacterium YR4-1]|uniref:Twin-arginine translocation pathway signal n=1 Tax=Halalkalibaculum roseum TaxID=2709311 RepID=A0A6M1SZA4_9BACT|nr:MBL fold metallo-hydrolase [Halalkalibaculum roseum]NGP75195.1 twin-arginine translocation pathway signal [Halalkalibaculum roseum]